MHLVKPGKFLYELITIGKKINKFINLDKKM